MIDKRKTKYFFSFVSKPKKTFQNGRFRPEHQKFLSKKEEIKMLDDERQQKPQK